MIGHYGGLVLRLQGFDSLLLARPIDPRA